MPHPPSATTVLNDLGPEKEEMEIREMFETLRADMAASEGTHERAFPRGPE